MAPPAKESAARKRKGSAKASGQGKAGNAATDANGSARKANGQQREPPTLGRVALRSTLAIVSLCLLVYGLWPILSHGPLSRLNVFRKPTPPASSPSAQERLQAAQKAQNYSEKLKELSPEEAAKYASRHLRPSLRLRIPSRDSPKSPVRAADDEKLEAVRQAFQDSWECYVRDAFGADEYHPISHSGTNFSTDGGVGYFIVDTLDILLITGNQQGYNRARDWVRDLQWSDKEGKFSVFETTIRTLGGLLSAHALCTPGQDTLSPQTSKLCASDDADMFLAKARTLAENLAPAFTSNVLGLPLREINFMTGEGYADIDNREMVSLAEIASIQLEFKYLAHATGDKTWWDLAERPLESVRKASVKSNSDGLLPIFFSPQTGDAVMSEIRLGSRGDSYYEYLIKQFIQTNRTELVYLDMYQTAMYGIKAHLIKQSPKRKLLHTGEIHPRMLRGVPRPMFLYVPKQDHLVCFLGGSYMLGALNVQEKKPRRQVIPRAYPPVLREFSDLAKEDWNVGHELIKTCVDTYTGTETGLSAEITMFRMPNDTYKGKEEDWYIKKPNQQQQPQKSRKPLEPLIDARNILRPETVESLFIAFHLSGDEIYRQWGWQIFQAFLRTTRLPDQQGFASIRDVNAHPDDIQREDRMETFWLAETLKYLYLLFADQNTLRLDQWVLNTEAHPLPIFNPYFETSVK